MQFAKRVGRIKPSATLEVIKTVAKLKNEGIDVISLSAGEPHSETMLNIKAAAIEAIHEGFTRYTPVDGCLQLKQAILKKYQRDNNLEFELNEVIASTGAKQSIANLILALIDKGDEVIIPAPYWVSYIDLVEFAGGTPVIIESDIGHNFKIRPEQIKAAITPKTKLFIFNNPSNPTGAYYQSTELASIGEIFKMNPHVHILSDDIYEFLIWGPEQYTNILNVCPELKDQVTIINGVSKSYAMTGWRLGYALGPAALIREMNKIQSQTTSCPSSISQAAAIEALQTPPAKVQDMIDQIHDLHDFAFKQLRNIPGFEVAPASGTFYILPKVTKAMEALNFKTDIEFCNFLLEKAHVAVVPGSAFGAPGHIRISFSTTQALLAKALSQIEAAITHEKSY
ncbi:MAG: pyridoxal phosphate-dependent aminotransferase [Gammaproteobacteria bacterium]|jgi:aspartate aminotransferase|nr:pyridoxal phosphate-dependent aminotransferase [Gammaproteobacteria bacterium]